MSFKYKRGIQPSVKVGDVFETYRSGFCVVLEYHTCDNVIVQFKDSSAYVTKCSVGSLKKGNVKNPFYPIINGIGYVGVGKYFTNQNRKATKAYDAWSGAMERCYGKNRSYKNKAYIGCTIHPDWHNFQVFADWYYKQNGCDKGYHLDKDLLISGSNIYSADTCCLLPKELNAAISLKPNKNSSLPLAVQELKGKYRSKIGSGNAGKTIHLGTFKTPEEASAAYVQAKERYIKNLALEWANRIEWKAFKALMDWKVYPDQF